MKKRRFTPKEIEILKTIPIADRDTRIAVQKDRLRRLRELVEARAAARIEKKNFQGLKKKHDVENTIGCTIDHSGKPSDFKASWR